MVYNHEIKGDNKMADEKQVLKINDKGFDPESVTEAGQKIIDDIYKVDSQIAHHQMNASICEVARGTLLSALEKESENFTEVELDDEPEVEPVDADVVA